MTTVNRDSQCRLIKWPFEIAEGLVCSFHAQHRIIGGGLDNWKAVLMHRIPIIFIR